jgi:NYN domain
MPYRTRVFIDFWNFSLQWRDRAGGAKIDWRRVPSVLLKEGSEQLAAVGVKDGLHLEETLVYASYGSDEAGRKLKRWLDTFLDNQPSFRVKARERRAKARPIHCRSCDKSHNTCPHCDEPLNWSPEKGVDAAIVTDMLSLASEGAYEVAILVSSDADFVPAVEWLQARGLKVLNATWSHHGFELAKTAWASMRLDDVIPELTRAGDH